MNSRRLEHPLRTDGVKRDRGDALYVTRGDYIKITPSIEDAERFCRWTCDNYYENATHTARELYNNSRLSTPGGDARLFNEGVKLYETGGDLADYEMRVRRALALAMRTCVGGRWAAASAGVLLSAQ